MINELLESHGLHNTTRHSPLRFSAMALCRLPYLRPRNLILFETRILYVDLKMITACRTLDPRWT